MAVRIVLLGPKLGPEAESVCPALEMSALDASALIQDGLCRVEVALRGGKLRDALTLAMTDDYIRRRGDGDSGKAWFNLTMFLRGMHGVRSIEVATPIPFD